MTDKIKHLDYIQQTITRMATVSFQIKARNIGLVSAILAFSAGKHDVTFLWVALLPAVMQWFLDSFYLRQEPLYHALYNDVRTDKPEIEDLSMDIYRYEYNPRMNRLKVMFSQTLLCFHGIVLAVIILAMCLLR